MKIHITAATERDVAVILDLIRQLAEYERLADRVTATEDQLRKTLFGSRPAAEVLLAATNVSMLYRGGAGVKADANVANKWAKFVADHRSTVGH